jgi:hypothetical protein
MTNLARWNVHEDADALHIRIELGGDHSIMLTYWKNGHPPGTTLGMGGRAHQLENATLRSLKEWLDAARGEPPREAA